MNTPSSPRCVSSLKILAAAVLFATTFQAHAQTQQTWNGTAGNGTWAAGTNWISGTAPGSTDTALFNSITFTNQPTAAASNNIAGITVGDGGTAYGALTFASGGPTIGTSGITVNGDGGTGVGQANFNNVTLNGTQTWTNNAYVSANGSAGLKTGTVTAKSGLGATTLTLMGNGTSFTNSSAIGISNFNMDLVGAVSDGTGTVLSLVVQTTGAGLVSLNGVNTFSGGLAVKSGAVKFFTATSAGTGTITLGDSTPLNTNTAQLMLGNSTTMANAINVAAGTTGTLTIGGLVGNTYSSVYSGAVTLANNLTIAGYGAATPGSNMFGTVMSGGFTGSGNLTLNTSLNGTVTISSNPVNMIGSITNNGTGLGTVISSAIGSNVTGVTQNSTTSSLVLSGANTYTGPTTITAGTLQVGNGTADGSITSSSSVTDNGLLVYNLVGSQTYANSISGTGNLTKTGAGTLILSGNNTYAGRTTISGGTLQLNRATGSLASSSNVTVGGTLGGGGKLNVDNTGASTSLATSPGTLSLGIGDNVIATTRTADFDQAVTFSSITANATHVAGATATFINSGSTNSATNGFVLSGVTANNFIDKGIFYGTTAANANYAWYDTAGYVRAINYGVDAGANSATSGTTATLASKTYQQITGAITAQGNATFTTFNINGNNDVTLATGTTFSVDSILKNGSAGNATISGGTGIKPSSGGEVVINTASSGDNLILTTPILGNGTNALTKAGAGTLTLNGANTINGTTTIAAGNLTIGSAGNLNGGSFSQNIQNYGTLNYASSANQTLSGVISGTGSINKTGTGNLTLSNLSSTFSGGVNLNQGMLTFSAGSPTVTNVNNVYRITSGGLGTGTLTVAGGTSINWVTGVSFAANNMVINGDFTLAGTTAGQRFTMQMPMVLGSATRTATITSNATALSAASVTSNATLGIRLSNVSNSLPSSSVDSGTLRFVGTGVATPGNGTTNTFSSLGISSNMDFINNAGLTIGSGVLASFGSNNVLGSTPDKYASLTVESGGYFTMNTQNGTVSLSNNQTVNSLSGSGVVTNLSTNATVYTSILTVAGNGTNTTFSGQIVDGAALNSTTNMTSTGLVALVKSGTGSLTLNGTNTYTGGTTLSGGILGVGSNNALGTGDITSAGGTLQPVGADISLSNNTTLTGTIGFLVSGSQNLTLTGTVTGNGSATKTLTNNIDPGKLLTLGNVVINVATGQQSLYLAGTGNTTVTGVISNGGNTTNVLNVTNTGTTIFSGNNTYTGVTSLGANGASAGTLQLTGNGTLGANATAGLNVFGGTLDLGNKTLGIGSLAMGNGTVGTTANILIGSGNLTLNGNVNYNSTVNDNGATISGVGGGLLTLAADRTFTVADSTAAANDLTISAIIANGGGVARALTKAGSGTLLLTAANTYSGVTTISAGTLKINASNNLGNAAATNTIAMTNGTLESTGNSYDLGANRTIAINSGNNTIQVDSGELKISGVISGNSGTPNLTKTGTGTLTLTGNNTWGGSIPIFTLSAGTLNINGNNASGGANFQINGGTTIDNTSGAAVTTANNGVIINGDFAFSTSAGTALSNLTISAATKFTGITADRTITLNGLGALTFSTLNNNADSARTLTVNNGAGTGATSLLAFTGYNLTNAGSTARTDIINGTGNVAINGAVADGVSAGSGLTYSGSGTLTLNGTNTFTGGLNIQSGTVKLVTAASAGAGLVTLGVAGDASSGTLDLNGGSRTINSLATAGTAANQKITNSAATAAIVNYTGAGTYTFGGVIENGAGGNTTAVTVNNASANLTLAGANTYTGTTAVNSGTLTLGHAGGTIADTGNVTVDANASGTSILNVAQDDTVGAVTVSRNGTISGTGTLTATSFLHATGGNAYFLSNLAGSGNLTSTNTPGTVVLSGNNTYSGGTFMPATLILGHKNALGTGGLSISGILQASVDLSGANAIGNNILVTGATASGSNNMTLSGNFTNTTGSSFTSSLNAGKELVLAGNVYLSDNATGKTLGIAGTGNTTISGVIANSANGSFSGTGNLAITNTGTTTLSGANTYNGTTTVGSSGGQNAGILKLSGSGTISTGPLSLYAGTLDLNGSAQTINGTFSIGGGASGSTANILIGSGALNLGVNISYSATNNPNGATISGLGGGAINLLGNRSFAVNDSTAALTDLTVSAIIANGDSTARSLTKTGNGTLLLSGSNTYNGTTTVSGGTLSVSNLGNATTANGLGMSSNAAANLLLGNGTTLQYSGAAASTDRLFTINGAAIGDAATLDASGSGAVNFTNTGSLAYGTGNQTRTLNLTGTNTGNNTLAALIASNSGSSGTTSVTKSGVGTWVLAGANTYNGTTSVNAGTLGLGSSGAVGTTGNITFGGGTLQFGANNTTDYSARFKNSGSAIALDTNGRSVSLGVIDSSNTAGLTKSGSGTLTLAGSQAYSGATLVTSGTLVVNGSVGGGGITVQTGATLGGNITAGGTTSIQSGGTLSVGNSPGAGSFSTLNLAGTTVMEFSVNPSRGSAGIAYDTIGVTSVLSYGGDLKLTFSGTVASDPVTAFNLFTGVAGGNSFANVYIYAGATQKGFLTNTGGVWTGLADLGYGDNQQSFTFMQSNGNLIVAVPEPATWALLAFSLTTVVVLRRRRQS